MTAADNNADFVVITHDQRELAVPSLLNNAYIEAATSNNTRRAYQSDIRHFERGGGRLPATPSQIAAYLEMYAHQLNPRTLARRLIAIRHWHVYQGFTDPTQHPAISWNRLDLI